jgi:predicted component of viral defense system (DUF524 family)
MSASASTEFRTKSGAVIAQLTLYARRGSLELRSESEARLLGEEPILLCENGEYDFTLSSLPAGWRLREIGPLTLRQPVGSGTLAPGPNAGRLTLTIEDAQQVARATASVEVATAKLGYREDFRTLLEDVAAQTTDLLLNVRSSFSVPVQSIKTSESTRIQRYFFVQALLSSTAFRQALRRVLLDPHQSLQSIEQELPSSVRISASSLRRMASGQPRRSVPVTHPLRATHHLATIPEKLPQRRAEPTTDTPENRFVRGALQSIVAFLAQAAATLPEARLRRDASALHAELLGVLAHPTLAFLSPNGPRTIPRQERYREVVLAFGRLQNAAALCWDGGDAVFAAGRRDVAQLYEYWSFFQLLSLLPFDAAQLGSTLFAASDSNSGFGLKLKAGQSLDLVTVYEQQSLRLSYNRTFSGEHSYSRPMRPDFTISLWPETLSEKEAEASGQVRHLHFDAKYRLNALSESFEREDLQKMHAYRDAIRGTMGAFVLYPGSHTQRWSLTKTGWPSVGAFSLRPNQPSDALAIKALIAQTSPEMPDDRQ